MLGDWLARKQRLRGTVWTCFTFSFPSVPLKLEYWHGTGLHVGHPLVVGCRFMMLHDEADSILLRLFLVRNILFVAYGAGGRQTDRQPCTGRGTGVFYTGLTSLVTNERVLRSFLWWHSCVKEALIPSSSATSNPFPLVFFFSSLSLRFCYDLRVYSRWTNIADGWTEGRTQDGWRVVRFSGVRKPCCVCFRYPKEMRSVQVQEHSCWPMALASTLE